MTTENLLKEIEQLVASQTFTAAALDGIQAIKKKLGTTLAGLDDANKAVKNWRDSYEALERESERMAARIGELQHEVGTLRNIVDKGQEAIYTAQKHEAVANAWKEAMQTVFKPHTVREAVSHSFPVVYPTPGGGGYTTTHSHQENITRTQE